MSVEYLQKTLINGFKNRGDKQWIEAFVEYNKNNTVKLSMQCRSCYFKVYKFIENKKNELD